MKLKLLLAMPYRYHEIEELKKILDMDADIYIFPEGFLHNLSLDAARKMIGDKGKFVISGYKQQEQNGTFEKVLVIDSGKVTDEYTKCILTTGEKEKGKLSGPKIHCVHTRYGLIGIPICYEIHFPEVVRIMALENPIMMINIIGTGMYHEKQYEQWTTLAKARAIENEVFVMGCSHFAGEIPLAFAYSPEGKVLKECKNHHGAVVVEIETNESLKKEINYFADRKPAYFQKICE